MSLQGNDMYIKTDLYNEMIDALNAALKELNRLNIEGAKQPRMVSQLALGLLEEVEKKLKNTHTKV